MSEKTKKGGAAAAPEKKETGTAGAETGTLYKIKEEVSQVFIGNTIYTKRDNVKFAESKEVLDAVKAGFLEIV